MVVNHPNVFSLFGSENPSCCWPFIPVWWVNTSKFPQLQRPRHVESASVETRSPGSQEDSMETTGMACAPTNLGKGFFGKPLSEFGEKTLERIS